MNETINILEEILPWWRASEVARLLKEKDYVLKINPKLAWTAHGRNYIVDYEIYFGEIAALSRNDSFEIVPTKKPCIVIYSEERDCEEPRNKSLMKFIAIWHDDYDWIKRLINSVDIKGGNNVTESRSEG